jgi:hypothetical protein
MYLLRSATLLKCFARILLSRPCVVWVCHLFVFESGLSLLSECYRFQGSSYLLNAVFIILEKGGEKFQFLGEEILLTKRR